MTIDVHAALSTKLQALVAAQTALRWTPPAMVKSLNDALAATSSLGVTIKLANSNGNGTAPSAGRKTDALSLGVGVSAGVAAKISAGISLGIGFSVGISLAAKLTAGLHATISQVGTLQRDLASFNASCSQVVGTNGVMPPGRKVEQGPVNSSLRKLRDNIDDCHSKAHAAADAKPISPISAHLHHPRIGAWECGLDLDLEIPANGKLKFRLDDLEFTGTVLKDHTGTDGPRSKCRVVAGNGHLTQILKPHSYSGGAGVKVGTIVTDILKDCGEDLSDLSDGPTLDKVLPRWHVSAVSAQQALTALAQQVDAAWRVLRDGTVWFGAETWPTVKPEGTLVHEAWTDGHLVLAAETPNMVPGTIYNGQKIEHVTHEFGSKLRTHVRTEGGSAVNAFAKVARLGQHIDFSREYPCEVVTQNPDGTLQLLPDDEIMKSSGLDHVPIRYGIPGIKATVSKGARCHLAFAAGDPTRPYVSVWEYDPEKVTLNSIFDGAQSLARVGDLVQSGGPGTIVTLMPITLVGAPPNNAIVAGVPCMISFSAIAPTPLSAAPLFGSIATGIPKFQG